MFKHKTGLKPLQVATRRQIISVILPLAACFTASVACSNLALVHCNAAFAEMMSGATPLCLVWINVVGGKGFNLQLLWPVLMVVSGVCMCVSGEVHFTRVGFILICSACSFRACKQYLQGKIMEHNTDVGTLEPIELLAYMSLPCFLMMFGLGFLIEGVQPYLELRSEFGPKIAMSIGVTVVNALILNTANNFAIRDLGAMGCTLAGQLKSILLFLGAAALLNEVIQKQQIAGYCLVTCGVYFYNRIDKKFRDGDRIENKRDLEALHEKVSEALKEDETEKMPFVK
jgi:drug/metabolite transporter (DMT)-like permease